MDESLGPLLFLVAVFVAFGMAFRDRRVRGCGDCSDECDKTTCDTAHHRQ